MIQTISLLSILAVVAEFLLPGFAWLSISGLSNRLSLSERVVLAFVISFSLSSLLTAGVAFLTPSYLILYPAISVSVSVVALGVYVLKRRPAIRRFTPRPARPHLLLGLAMSAYVIMLVALFWSSPHYPNVDANDLLAHARVTEMILQGGGKEVLSVFRFPTGLHFASAILANILQLNALDALRILTSMIVLAMIPLIFFTARALFKDDRAAGLTVAVGAFALPVDAFHLVHIGTFPNIAGDALMLSVLWLFLTYLRRPDRASGISLAFLTVAGMFMHSGFLVFFAALWITVPLVFAFSRKASRNYLRALVTLSLGLVVLSPVLFYFVQGNVVRVFSSYVDVGQAADPSSLAITYFNFLYNIGYFIGWPNLAIAALSIVLILKEKQRKPGMILLLVWFGTLVVAPLLSENTDRFVLFAMLPATFLVGNTLWRLSNRLGSLPAGKRHAAGELVRIVVPLMLTVLILTGSLLTFIPYLHNPQGRTHQDAIFDSMVWLRSSPCTRGVASSGLWSDYRYLPALTGIPYAGDFLDPPEVVLAKSSQLNFTCVAVATTNPYFDAFQMASEFKGGYENEIVAVFLIRAA